MEMNADGNLVIYTMQPDSEKGPYTCNYFNLQEREVGSFDQAQGLDVPDDLTNGALEAQQLASRYGQ